MPWTWRPYGSRYDPRYDPYYYRRRPQGTSCLRDACLLETGCCIGEALDGNCLMVALPLIPRLLAATTAPTVGRGRAAGTLLAAIRFYQREISAHRPAVCRFTPSCSEYAAQAIDRYGAVRGLGLAVKRLGRCRPGGRRGLDPLPGAG